MKRLALKLILSLQILLLVVAGVWILYTRSKIATPDTQNASEVISPKDDNGFEILSSISELSKFRNDPTPGSKIHAVKLTGTLLRGAQIDRAFCSTGIYLKDQTGKIQLRVKSPNERVDLYTDDSLIGKDVNVKAYYPTGETRCQALVCSCDDYLIVAQLFSSY